ncbi:MAG: ComEA family DNA-binding protein [Pseudomonadota bacterium]
MQIFKTLALATALLAGAAFAGEPVNVNTADAQQLAQGLDGVGLSKAEAIVAYREENGAFAHPDELVNVKGIGIRTVDRNRDNIRLDDAERSASKPGR